MNEPTYAESIWDKIDEANIGAGVYRGWSISERDQMEALADEMNRDLEPYRIIHAWPTKDRSQLTFWCRYCKTYHVHGRHSGTSYIDAVNRYDAHNKWVPRIDAVLPLRLWRRYLQRFAKCMYNSNVPGGRESVRAQSVAETATALLTAGTLTARIIGTAISCMKLRHATLGHYPNRSGIGCMPVRRGKDSAFGWGLQVVGCSTRPACVSGWGASHLQCHLRATPITRSPLATPAYGSPP